jgi:hypothetical protein
LTLRTYKGRARGGGEAATEQVTSGRRRAKERVNGVFGEELVKTGARLVRYARRLILQLAEVAVTRDLFGQILSRIRLLLPAPT